MNKEKMEYLQRIEERAAETGWVAPLTQEDKDYFVYLGGVCKRYNIRSCTNRGKSSIMRV